MSRQLPPIVFVAIVSNFLLFASLLPAQEPASDAPAKTDAPAEPSPDAPKKQVDPKGLVRIAKDYDVWIDPIRKYVVIDGTICLRQGTLEMFACTRGTKEHESIISVNSPARFIHAALLAVGAKTGNTVKWDPMYVPASGTQIDIWVLWKDRDGMERKVKAQKFVRNITTEKAMTFNWVFAGSGFWDDETTGERHYMADAGDFICVSNFSTATLDLPVESSAQADGLLFEAFTENIPTRGTNVRLVLVPRLDKDLKRKPDDKPASTEAPKSSSETPNDES